MRNTIKHVLAACLMCASWLPHAAVQAGSYENFFKAIDLDHVKSVNVLLQRGMDPNTITENGTPALIHAMSKGALAAVNALLQAPNLDVNLRDFKGDTALMLASYKNQTEWVRALLQRGATHTEAGRWNALHYAASSGAMDTIHLLLKAGADVNVHSENNTTPLMMAARSGQAAAVHLLIKHGAEPKLINDAGFDAEAYAMKAKRPDLAREIRDDYNQNF